MKKRLLVLLMILSIFSLQFVMADTPTPYTYFVSLNDPDLYSAKGILKIQANVETNQFVDKIQVTYTLERLEGGVWKYFDSDTYSETNTNTLYHTFAVTRASKGYAYRVSTEAKVTDNGVTEYHTSNYKKYSFN